MAGLDPAIHDGPAVSLVDARLKAGHDGGEVIYLVVTGLSRSKNGVASLAYVPVTSLREAVRP